MPCLAATLPRVTALERRLFALDDFLRPVWNALVVVLGTAGTAAAMAGAVTATAAWLLALALGGAPHTAARTPLGLHTAALTGTNAGLVGTVIAGLSPAFIHADDGAALSPQQAVESTKGPRLDRRPRVAAAHVSTPAAPAHVPAPAAAASLSEPLAAAFDLFDPAPATGAALAFAPDAGLGLVPGRFAALADAMPSAPLPPAPPSLSQRPETAQNQTPRPRETAGAPRKLPQIADITGSLPASASVDLPARRLMPQPVSIPLIPLPAPDSHTALYDIEAHTVYMPDGSKLEAHSGLGFRMDDPRHVGEKARGATPPNVYELTLRGELFHGVRAIRLNPVSDGKMFGRDGILAHPYMLGPTGQSFGCVSFKDYPEFLKAFEKGEVDHLVVVPHRGPRPAGDQRAGRDDIDTVAPRAGAKTGERPISG